MHLSSQSNNATVLKYQQPRGRGGNERRRAMESLNTPTHSTTTYDRQRGNSDSRISPNDSQVDARGYSSAAGKRAGTHAAGRWAGAGARCVEPAVSE